MAVQMIHWRIHQTACQIACRIACRILLQVILQAVCTMVGRIADTAVFRTAKGILGQMVCQTVEKTTLHAIQQAIRETTCLTAVGITCPTTHRAAPGMPGWTFGRRG